MQKNYGSGDFGDASGEEDEAMSSILDQPVKGCKSKIVRGLTWKEVGNGLPPREVKLEEKVLAAMEK
jgi:hypothetical protein